MKIMFVINGLNRVALNECLLSYFPAGSNSDIVTVVVLQSRGDLSDEIMLSGHRLIHLGASKTFLGLFSLFRLPAIFLRVRPHVVHSWLYQSDLLTGITGYFTE